MSEFDVPGVSEGSADRALRLLGHLVDEAGRRGHLIEREHDGQAGVWVNVSGNWSRLIMSEELEARDRSLAAAEMGERKIYPWQRVQLRSTAVPSGRLTIEIAEDHRFSGRRRRWVDRQRWQLEDKLTEVLAELEARADILARRRLVKEQERAHRHQQWQEAIADAREHFVEDHRRRALADQVAAWTQARAVLSYCDALDALGLNEADPARAAELGSWSRWAREYAAARDPLNWHSLLPRDPDPRPEELAPFLGQWSPYGPDEPMR
jgi:hypothetical protein